MEAMGNDVCRACGACCAALRVGFPESETTRRGGAVPFDLTEAWIPRHRRMIGTGGASPRCTALDGKIGERTTCRIYGNHPTPCKELVPSTPDAPNPYCDDARRAHGLTPLSEGGAPAPRRRAPKAEAAPAPAPTPVPEQAPPPLAPQAPPPAAEPPPKAPDAE